MGKMNGIHQTFQPGKPYWLKPPKTDAQRRHFARMASKSNSRQAQTTVKPQTSHSTPINGDDPPDFDTHLSFGIDEDPIDLETPAFVAKIQQDRLDEERQARDVLLAESSQEMFNAYIECHLLTHEWADPKTWDQDHLPECQCRPSQRRERSIDLVDLLCTCNYYQVQRSVW